MRQIRTLSPKDAKFIYYSIRERLAFQELAKHMNYNLHYMSDHEGYESWDVIYTDKHRSIAEIKVRKHNSTAFDGWVFEKRKLTALTTNTQGRLIEHIPNQPVYVLFLFDGVYIWDVNKMNPEDFKSDRLRKESVNDDMGAVDKDVIYLSLKDAQKIDYVLDYDKLGTHAKIVFKAEYPNNNNDVINL